MKSTGLPIEAVLSDLQTALAALPCAVLQAPPGAGKTTLTPLFLKDAAWLGNRKIVLLEPRRLAARAAAMRMAALLGEEVGQTVGYRMRLDSRVGPTTRVEVVTEGVLTRMLQSDPALAGVGLVIFDEFHERSLDADLGLALCLDMQGVLNQELRLLIMSATLVTDPLVALLKGAPVIRCSGREFPVATRYVGRHAPESSVAGVVDAVLAATRQETGSILVFLPGAWEIRKMQERLKALLPSPEWLVAPLFGNLSQLEQDLAIAPPPPGKRKIVLATSIAETSLTIDGIGVVVDSGLSRYPRFDVRSGMSRLVTGPVSRSAADQRRGRAGRTGPGVCLRLWSQAVHPTLPAAVRPEITEADLTGLVLELAVWGVKDAGALKWLDPPATPAFENAKALLQSLGALDHDAAITEHGRRMARLPTHPRLAHMLLTAADRNQGGPACDLAALLSERDVLQFDSFRQHVDIQLRMDLIRAARLRQPFSPPYGTVDQAVLRRVLRIADQLRKRLGCSSLSPETLPIGSLAALAYPDRLALQRPGRRGRFLLTSGRGAFVESEDPLSSQSLLVALELDGDRREAKIFKAAAYNMEALLEQFKDRIQTVEMVDWDAERKMVDRRRETKLGALVLKSELPATSDPQQIRNALLMGILKEGLACLPWTSNSLRLRQRVSFSRRLLPPEENWPDMTDAGLSADLQEWLAPHLTGMSGLRDLNRLDLEKILAHRLTYSQKKRLDNLAPTHFEAPSGSRIPIDYSGDVPVVAVRLQELFGLRETPCIAGGSLPLLVHLLSPAGRPVQITRDLAGFWQNSYHMVKKELKGRYPKHYWPDDPLHAQATARVRPQKTSSP